MTLKKYVNKYNALNRQCKKAEYQYFWSEESSLVQLCFTWQQKTSVDTKSHQFSSSSSQLELHLFILVVNVLIPAAQLNKLMAVHNTTKNLTKENIWPHTHGYLQSNLHLMNKKSVIHSSPHQCVMSFWQPLPKMLFLLIRIKCPGKIEREYQKVF
ncbi:hypothetical protein FGO68_gene17199 [Halteria grandinella]|uniref:Uncharacterized protein n=1 Tax=Halteria grandinella TaxID=5974 RepID=A0A8J8NPC5_HALGN|nr:hypothetical protein FGO68_gene17199 [Halteria grandinella]